MLEWQERSIFHVPEGVYDVAGIVNLPEFLERHAFDMAIEQKCSSPVLDRWRQRLGARDHGALVGRLKPQQHRRDIGLGKQAGEASHQ